MHARKDIIIAGILLAALGAVALWVPSRQETKTTTMTIASPSFKNGGTIPVKFTCDGSGTSPELRIEGVPADAKSLALILHDPDAPVAGGFTHWIVWNISPTTTAFAANGVPPGSVEGRNDAGRAGYVSPCPPSGTHRYVFELYALSAPLELSGRPTAEQARRAMAGRVIGKATLTGTYRRAG